LPIVPSGLFSQGKPGDQQTTKVSATIGLGVHG
jgi:hypothetical protein